MNKTVKRIAVTFVTALLILGMSVSGFAYDYDGIFFVTENYPFAETLKYGVDTVVVDVPYGNSAPNQYLRFQASQDTKFWVIRTYNNDTYYYQFTICSNNPIYVYNYYTGTGQYTETHEITMGSAYDYRYHINWSDSYPTQGQFLFYSSVEFSVPPNLNLGEGVVLLVPKICKFPTSTDAYNDKQFDKINDALNDGFTSVNDNLADGFSSVNQGITQAVDDILNAGSDMPSLDTDNSWMNDSLTKVNEWVSSIDAFKEQMQEAKEENAENMQQAKTFINGFFEVLPTSIIAILTLGLVVIVVVKVIGR